MENVNKTYYVEQFINILQHREDNLEIEVTKMVDKLMKEVVIQTFETNMHLRKEFK